jgi:autotransporter-associated beta strand protein
VNLNGGKLVTPGFNKSSGNGTINLNGGTVEASGSIPEFFTGFSSGEVVIQGGGAKIDTAGNTVTTAVPLTGAGSFTKLGAGEASLNGNNTYSGDTIIQQGTLSFSFASINDVSSVYISTGGFLDLNTSGQTDVIGNLFLNGVAQAAGVWGALGSGAQFESSFITGNGFVSVAAVPEPGTIGLLVASGLGLVFIRRKSLRH